MEENVYLAALEHGIEKMGQKLTYHDMKNYLMMKFPTFVENYELYFIIWFFKNFHNPRMSTFHFQPEWLDLGQKIDGKDIRGVAKMVAVFGSDDVSITAEGFFNYIEYVELNEARKSAQDAHVDAISALKLARFALWVSASLAGVSIILQVLSYICG